MVNFEDFIEKNAKLYELVRKTGIIHGPCGVTDIKKIEEVLGDCQITLYRDLEKPYYYNPSLFNRPVLSFVT